MIVRLTPGFLPKAFGTGMTKGCGNDKKKAGMTKETRDGKEENPLNPSYQGETLNAGSVGRGEIAKIRLKRI